MLRKNENNFVANSKYHDRHQPNSKVLWNPLGLLIENGLGKPKSTKWCWVMQSRGATIIKLHFPTSETMTMTNICLWLIAAKFQLTCTSNYAKHNLSKRFIMHTGFNPGHKQNYYELLCVKCLNNFENKSTSRIEIC